MGHSNKVFAIQFLLIFCTGLIDSHQNKGYPVAASDLLNENQRLILD